MASNNRKRKVPVEKSSTSVYKLNKRPKHADDSSNDMTSPGPSADEHGELDTLSVTVRADETGLVGLFKIENTSQTLQRVSNSRCSFSGRAYNVSRAPINV